MNEVITIESIGARDWVTFQLAAWKQKPNEHGNYDMTFLYCGCSWSRMQSMTMDNENKYGTIELLIWEGTSVQNIFRWDRRRVRWVDKND